MAVAWPGAYADWARRKGEPGWPEEDRSCVATPDEQGFVRADAAGISWPADGSVFYLDPRDPLEHQAIPLRASLPHGSPPVRWVIDDQILGEVSSPYSMRWVPTVGEHQIRLESEGLTLDRVQIWIGGSTE
jgi:hypothetical protein